jgi:HAD superfamily hydrolase (TIGR01450 family)
LSALTSFETYVFDCDGVIWGISDEATTHSVATINYLLQLGKRVMFVTNNSNKSRRDFVDVLESKGVQFGAKTSAQKVEMMVSCSFTAAKYLVDRGYSKPYVIASATGVLDELRLAGITGYHATVQDDGSVHPDFHDASSNADAIVRLLRDRQGVDCIVVGWDLALTARKVALAVNIVQQHEDLHGADAGYTPIPIFACAVDSGGVLGTYVVEASAATATASPSPSSTRVLSVRAIGNGAMAGIIARSFDPPLPWLDLGKPSDILIDMMKTAYGVNPATALMVGDTLQTDIAFGNRCGMSTLLVLSGVSTQEALDGALAGADPARCPDFVLPMLGQFSAEGLLK